MSSLPMDPTSDWSLPRSLKSLLLCGLEETFPNFEWREGENKKHHWVTNVTTTSKDLYTVEYNSWTWMSGIYHPDVFVDIQYLKPLPTIQGIQHHNTLWWRHVVKKLSVNSACSKNARAILGSGIFRNQKKWWCLWDCRLSKRCVGVLKSKQSLWQQALS